MKKLTTQNGMFGPYTNVEALSDRYRCDDFDLPFAVVGKGTVEDALPGDFPNTPQVPTVAEYTSSVQNHLDTEAKTRNYDGILSACTYAGSSIPKFAAEGQACVLWRDSVWATCYTILGEVQSGQRPAPTIPELLGLLPAMNWPEV